MSQSVVIKSNKYGITVVLSDAIPYEELKSAVADKFKQSAAFFKDADLAISFEGRELVEDQVEELIEIITSNSDINLVCIVDNDKTREGIFRKAFEKVVKPKPDRREQDRNDYEDMSRADSVDMAVPEDLESKGGQFYKGTLRSGQVIDSKTSVVILGDVNPDAKIISNGNIIVLGALKGMAYAGADGNSSAFVVALDMDPMQIRIGNYIARSDDKMDKRVRRVRLKRKETTMQPQIAFVEDGNIALGPITKKVLHDMPL